MSVKRRKRVTEQNLLKETACFTAKAIAGGFLTSLGMKLGNEFVKSASKKDRANVLNLRKAE